MKLYHDKVLLKKQEVSETLTTEGGIFLPDSYAKQNDTQRGTVIAIGPGLYTPTGVLIPMSAQVGSVVTFDTHGDYKTIKIDGDDYLLVRDSDLFGEF